MSNSIAHRYFALFILAASLLLSSCSNSRRAEHGKPLRKYAPNVLVKKNERSDIQFEWLGMKVSADMKNESSSESFKATIRVRKDSMIYISLSPALGVEMVRMIITPDSVKYISKIPNNKHYYLGDFSVINDVTQVPLDFSMIQNMLVGNAIMLDKGDDKFVSIIHEGQYVLFSRFSRKLKKIVGFDEKQMLPETTFQVNTSSRDYQRMVRRSTVEDLMVKRFWLNGYDFKVERALYNDMLNMRDIELIYSDFKEEDDLVYPAKCKLRVDSREDWQELTYRITRISTSKTYDFPFDIPDDYERRY
jgi:hypothetical protein